MLEVRLLNQETSQLYDQVVAEQLISERLLLNVLPQAIVERLKERHNLKTDRRSSMRSAVPWHEDTVSEIIADSIPQATVLFADIVGFTKFTESVSAQVVVGILNDLFTRFDSIVDKRGLEKIKTIGDAYMAVAGLPVPQAEDAERAAHMALDMIEATNQFNSYNKYNLKLRIGMDSGPVVAGVIGKHKFHYDLWGNVVNTASRMESHGIPGRIQITSSTRKLLGEHFILEERGEIEIKSKGMMNTWFLNGRQ